ncbi:helix-turn-helix transcriptional regulator [Oribacterium sp. oral taxon 102]|uniref:ArsR/SmtB family transcription factor n=1 Tax=Oribacterium sp. oral taxon 102 TaxID=671214 RepID=UPI0015BC36BB|nr:metalloregulator ArsR/SmtB family transcription factor [Oribacterium sp. oral taxon 102]NWO21000.1 helix-turn-helix transcriptional regulator [Oribacterium sp. oral taxon 102]
MTKEMQLSEKKVKHLVQNISEAELCDLAELFKIFGDSTRIRILYDLFEQERNVTELCADLEMNQSAVSHQLKILRTSKLIRARREGKTIVYSLADEHVKAIIAMGKEHIEE